MNCLSLDMCSAECTSYKYNITLGSLNDEKFQSIVTDMGLICDKAWIVPFVWSLFSIGNAVGSLLGGPISDRLGRRRAIFYTNLCVIFGGFCAVFCTTWQLFAVCWLIIWTASAACYLTGSVYVIELLGDQSREWAMSVSLGMSIYLMN